MHATVVTVTYQPGALLEPTMESVRAQEGVRMDYVVVDGASTDGTVDRLRNFAQKVLGEESGGGRPGAGFSVRWISEPDNGLYDAMNKGLAMAEGDYVLFLNAGDTLAHPRVLADLWAEAPGKALYYGHAMVVESMGGRELGLRRPLPPSHLNWRSLRFGMVVSHQAFVVRRELALPYDLQYKICADIDWMIRCLKTLTPSGVDTSGGGVYFIDKVMVQFLDGGLSSQRRKAAWKERYRILSHHYGAGHNLLNHAWIILRYVLRLFIPKFA
jgi:glycosyltransferase involved in cell wall biosynthesis